MSTTTYVVALVNLADATVAKITKHPDRVQAGVYGENLKDANTVVTVPDDLTADPSELLSLLWLLKPSVAGEQMTTTQKEVFDVLVETAKPWDFTDVKMASPEKGPTTMSEAQTETTSTAAAPAAAKAKPAAKKTTAAKPAKAAKAPKEKAAPKVRTGKGKPAGKVADFGQVLKNSKRANILELMDGTKTVQQIADKLKIPAPLVSSNIFCLNRDIGIGYSYADDGKVTALYPAGKSLAHALRVKEAPKPKAAAKKPVAKKADKDAVTK